MRALLIGGAGYVGSAVARSLLSSGWDVAVIDALYTGNREFLLPAVKFHRCDCGISTAVGEIVKETPFDVAISFIAMGANCRSREFVFHYYHNNFIATYYLLQTLLANRLRKFIFSSDFSVYAAGSKWPIRSSTAKGPTDSLGRSILAAETLIEDLSTNCGLEYAIIRCCEVGGAVDGGPPGPLLPVGRKRLLSSAFAAALGKEQFVEIPNGNFQAADGSAPFDILHIEDVADVYCKVTDELTRRSGGREFNLASGNPPTISDIIATVSAVTGREVATKQTDQSDFTFDGRWADPWKARDALAWRSRRDLRQIVESEWRALQR